jgi:ficolin
VVDCGPGRKTRRRLRDVAADNWQDKVEEVACSQDCGVLGKWGQCTEDGRRSRERVKINNNMLKKTEETKQCDPWIVIQRRLQGGNSPTYFAKDFKNYQAGFTQNGELWLGLETLTELTSRGGFELKVEMKTWANEKHYAYYSDFKVGPGPDYQLTVAGFHATRSNLGDSLNRHNGQKFSAKDKDQDTRKGTSCSHTYGNGGWWYKDCHHCNINGHNYPAEQSSNGKGLTWNQGGTARGDSYITYKETQMAVRKLGN